MGKFFQLAMVALLLIVSLNMGSGQEESLHVHVVTPDGVGKQGIVVTASLGTVTARATTNATGWAVLGGLQPGAYTVTISISDVTLNSTVVEFPAVTTVSLVAPLGSMNVAVVDSAGRPLSAISVVVSSFSGRLEVTQRTNATGYATFQNLPFTAVEAVGGGYRVRVVKEGLTVGSAEASLDQTAGLVRVIAKLLNLDVTVLDKAGSPLKSQATVSLKAGNYSQSANVQDGKATLSGVVSSDIVGEYDFSVVMKVANKDITVFTDRRIFTSDIGLEIEVDVGNILVKVLDDSGAPVPGIVVVVNSDLLGAFAGGRTDRDGQLKLIGIPFSTTEAGDYNLTAYRGRTIVSAQPLRLDAGNVSVNIVLRLVSVRMTVLDSAGAPLTGAEVVMSDPLTGRNSTSVTDSGGQAGFSAFPGPNDVSVIYKNVVVLKKTLDVSDRPITLAVNSVNFPVSISVIDALGRHASGLQLTVSIDGRQVYEGILVGQPLVITSEIPGLVRVDVSSDGRLLARETAHVSEAARLEVRFSDYVFLGGGVIPFEIVLSAVIGFLLVVVLASAYRGWSYSRQH